MENVTRNLKGGPNNIQNAAKNLKRVHSDIRKVRTNRQGIEVVNQEGSQNASVEGAPTGRQDRQNKPESNAQDSRFIKQDFKQRSSQI